MGGLSKDFGLSGFRVGITYTLNKDILKSSTLTYGCLNNVSSHTQYVLQKMFEDSKWIDAYVIEFQKRLTRAHKALKKALESVGIKLYPSSGTLMAWADFSKFLRKKSWEGEDKLWQELVEKCKWNVMRGREFGFTQPGHMRIMYTA